MGLMDILNEVISGNTANLDQHFDQVAQTVSPQQLGHGITAAFNSDQTPPFSNMVGQLFGQSNRGQQAGLLNQLIATVGPKLALERSRRRTRQNHESGIPTDYSRPSFAIDSRSSTRDCRPRRTSASKRSRCSWSVLRATLWAHQNLGRGRFGYRYGQD